MCPIPKNNTESMTAIDISQLGVDNIKSVYVNTTQEVLIVNKEKVELCLMQHLKLLEKRRDWIAPVGILISILLTIVTCSFKKNALGLSGDTWMAFFLFAAIAVLCWLFYSVIIAFKAGGIPDILDKLTKEAQNIPVEPQATTNVQVQNFGIDVQAEI